MVREERTRSVQYTEKWGAGSMGRSLALLSCRSPSQETIIESEIPWVQDRKLNSTLTLGHSPRQGPWALSARGLSEGRSSALGKDGIPAKRANRPFPKDSGGHFYTCRSAQQGELLLGAQGRRESVSPRNVFHLEKMGFELISRKRGRDVG